MNVKDITDLSDLCYTIKYKVERYTEIKWLADKIKDSGVRLYNINVENLYDYIVSIYLSSKQYNSAFYFKVNNNEVLFVDKVDLAYIGRNPRIVVYLYRYIEKDEQGLIHIYIAMGDKCEEIN